MVQQQTVTATRLGADAGPTGDGAATVVSVEQEIQAALAAAANPTPELQERLARARGPITAGIFAGLSDQQLLSFLVLGQPRRYQPGDVIIPYGDTGDSLYVLLNGGKIRIVVPVVLPPPVGEWLSGEKSLLELPTPIVVGHVNLLVGGQRTATVEAVEELDALEVSKAQFEQLAQIDPRTGYLLARNIAANISSSVDRTNQENKKLIVALALASRALGRGR